LDLDTTASEGGEAFRLQMRTELFRRGVSEPALNQEEMAVVSDRGLESFEIVQSGTGLKSQTRGERQGDSLIVTVDSEGVQGRLAFDVKAFDVSTYELLLLERSDLGELAQEQFRLFDPEDLDIYVARLHSQGQLLTVNNRQIRVHQVVLNVEGVEFRMTMTQDGELLALRSGEFNAAMATEKQCRERRMALISRAA
jgi:hypothetical protein